jgi:hypothetical protein
MELWCDGCCLRKFLEVIRIYENAKYLGCAWVFLCLFFLIFCGTRDLLMSFFCGSFGFGGAICYLLQNVGWLWRMRIGFKDGCRGS